MKNSIWIALIVLAGLCVSGDGAAKTLLDWLRPHVGEPAEIGNGRQVLDATLTSVGDDHFCALLHVPEFEHSRCYNQSAVAFVVQAGEKHKLRIQVVEPGGK